MFISADWHLTLARHAYKQLFEPKRWITNSTNLAKRNTF